tara:strand:- start:416 stop:874 length:459 start_codon:yes stop_codon:yes gene_type:complete
MPEIETQTNPCYDVIDKLNEEFLEINNENDQLKKENNQLKKENKKFKIPENIIIDKDNFSNEIKNILEDQLSIYDMLDSSDYPSQNSIVHKIIHKLHEFTNHENREWCEMKVLQTFNKFEFFLLGMRECQMDYYGPLGIIYDYFVDDLLNEF